MDSDEENEYTQSWKGVPGCIVLINVYDASNHGTAEVALAATSLLVRHNLRLANSNHIGVCLYGTEDSNSSAFGIQSVVDICPLNTTSLADFKKIRKLDISSFKQSKEFKMSDVLWHCSKMFANCKKQLSSRTVLLLSRLDSPPINTDQKPTIKRVDDLVDSNIDVKFLNIAESDYTIDKFYENFLFEASKGKGVIIPKAVWDHKEIAHLMHQQTDRHLAVSKLSLQIGEGLEIGVGVYNLIKSQSYGQKKTDINREDSAVVTSISKAVKISQRPDTGEPMDVDDGTTKTPLLKSEILYYQDYQGERVEFTDNEMKILKNPFGPPMMKLLGFKPSKILCKEKWFLKPCHFLFPNESVIEGSIIAFKAMHKACLDMSMVAICVLCTRINARPKIVALSPCTSPLGQDVEIGFDVIQLPFVENVREVPVVEDDEEQKVSNAHKSVMTDILNTLKFNYNSNSFENPKTQSQIRAVEAIALEDDDVEPFVDTTKPDPDKFKDLQDDLFEEIFGPFGPTVQKRGGTTGAEAGAKKQKLEELGPEEQHALLMHRISNKEVNKFTVKDLKTFLSSTNNTIALNALKKHELVDLIYKHYVNGN